MIRGYFSHTGSSRRPFLNAVFYFPTFNPSMEVPLLLDTGADRTILAPFDALRLARRLRISLTTLPSGAPSAGVGGQAETRTVDAVLSLDAFSTPLSLTILQPPPGPLPAIPSLLGRDVLSRFGLFVEQRTNRVLLLEPHEADAFILT